MCLLTIILLIKPGTSLDVVWRIKPSAQHELAALGAWPVPLLTMTGLACACAAIGLTRQAEWGRRAAIIVLSANLLGDLTNAVLRQDWRTLIGLPIGGAMIAYLASSRVRRYIDPAAE